MSKRIFALIFATYFVVLGLSPLWGLHSHDCDDSRIIHSHEQSAFESVLSLEKEVSFPLETTDSHAQNTPVSVFEYLLGDKTCIDISVTQIVDIEYLSIAILDIKKDLLDTSVIRKFPLNLQTTRLFSRLISNSLSSRAPPSIS